MKPFFLILSFFSLLSCFVPIARADDSQMIITADMQFAYAEGLYNAKDYPTAQVELKRFTHFFPKDDRRFEAEFKIAMSLYFLEQYHDAARQFNHIILRDRDDRFTQESYFMQSQAFMKMGNQGYAQIILQNFLKLTEDSDVRDRIYLALARIHIQDSKKLGIESLDEAQAYLTMITPGNQEKFGTGQQIKVLEKARNIPQKSPTLSGIFSIIPGGGFLYCERYHDAFIAFCLNAGLMYAAHDAFDSGNSALGGVITFVETGFYTGNIYGSISAAHKYNKAQQIKILNREFNLGAELDLKNSAYYFSLNHPF